MKKYNHISKSSVIAALDGRSITAAANYLGISRSYTRALIKKFSITVDYSNSLIAIKNGAKNGGIALHKKHTYRGEDNPNWKGGISSNNYHYKKIQIARYPERVKARNAVSRALKSGRLIKKPCVKCGDNKSFAHHTDYSKPLDVVWLCRTHHRAEHNNRH